MMQLNAGWKEKFQNSSAGSLWLQQEQHITRVF